MLLKPGTNNAGACCSITYTLTLTPANYNSKASGYKTSVQIPCITNGSTKKDSSGATRLLRFWDTECRVYWGDGTSTAVSQPGLRDPNNPTVSRDTTTLADTALLPSNGLGNLASHDYSQYASKLSGGTTCTTTIKICSFNRQMPAGYGSRAHPSYTGDRLLYFRASITHIQCTEDPIGLVNCTFPYGVLSNLFCNIVGKINLWNAVSLQAFVRDLVLRTAPEVDFLKNTGNITNIAGAFDGMIPYTYTGDNAYRNFTFSTIKANFNRVTHANSAFANSCVGTILNTDGTRSTFPLLANANKMFADNKVVDDEMFINIPGDQITDASYMWQNCTKLKYLHTGGLTGDYRGNYWRLPLLQNFEGFLKGCVNVRTLPYNLLAGDSGYINGNSGYVGSFTDSLTDIALRNVDDSSNLFITSTDKSSGGGDAYLWGASAKTIFSRIRDIASNCHGMASNIKSYPSDDAAYNNYFLIGVGDGKAVTNLRSSLDALNMTSWSSRASSWSGGDICAGTHFYTVRRYNSTKRIVTGLITGAGNTFTPSADTANLTNSLRSCKNLYEYHLSAPLSKLAGWSIGGFYVISSSSNIYDGTLPSAYTKILTTTFDVYCQPTTPTLHIYDSGYYCTNSNPQRNNSIRPSTSLTEYDVNYVYITAKSFALYYWSSSGLSIMYDPVYVDITGTSGTKYIYTSGNYIYIFRPVTRTVTTSSGKSNTISRYLRSQIYRSSIIVA